MRGVRGYHMPEAPTACMLCGTPYGLSRQPFRFGPRSLDLPVCQGCWKRHERARVVLAIAVAVGGLALAGGLALVAVAGGVGPALAGLAVACALVAPALAYRRRQRPQRVSAQGIVIAVPGVGRVRVDGP